MLFVLQNLVIHEKYEIKQISSKFVLKHAYFDIPS